MIQIDDFPDATELLRQMRSGEHSAEEIMRDHLDRIELEQPNLNAATQIFRDNAIEEARNPLPGALSGLPITLKETFGISKCDVTMGSRRMRPIHCLEDSEPVKRLRAAGAIIIARSNVPEFVMTVETDNLLYGRTNHSKDPTLTSGGSSGGEGALVGSGCSPLGFGTDILGSIRVPACLNGLVGFRPHSGAIDKTGVWPISGDFFETLNGIGPLARSVRDARLAYNVIAHEPLPALAEVSGLRLIVPNGFPLKYKSSCIKEAYLDSQEKLQTAGMLLEHHTFPNVKKLHMNIPKLVIGEMIDLWVEWLSSNGEKFKPSVELIRQLIRRPTVYPAFFKWFIMSPLMRPRGLNSLPKIIKKYEDARKHYCQLIGADGILILPTLGLLAPKHDDFNRFAQQPYVNGLFTAEMFANYINLSAITVPAHRHADAKTGLKPGIMLACIPGSEAKLLDAASYLERFI